MRRILGLDPAPLPVDMFRVQAAGVLGPQRNLGEITIENSAGGTVYEQISVNSDGDGFGRSHSAAYTVPKNYTLVLNRALPSVEKSETAQFLLRTDIPDLGPRDVELSLSGTNPIDLGDSYSELTDIEVLGKKVGAEIVLVTLRGLLVFMGA